MQRLKTIKWDEGASEILEFCLLIPFAMFFLLTFLNIAFYVRAGQLAEYCAYIGGRAAVVVTQDGNSSTEDRIETALAAATGVVSTTMSDNHYQHVDSIDDLDREQWTDDISIVYDTGEDQVSWIKGTLMKYSITMAVPNFLTDEHTRITSNLVMMVETPIVAGTRVL